MNLTRSSTLTPKVLEISRRLAGALLARAPPEELSHPIHPREQLEGALLRWEAGEDGGRAEGGDVRQKLREVFSGGSCLGREVSLDCRLRLWEDGGRVEGSVAPSCVPLSFLLWPSHASPPWGEVPSPYGSSIEAACNATPQPALVACGSAPFFFNLEELVVKLHARLWRERADGLRLFLTSNNALRWST